MKFFLIIIFNIAFVTICINNQVLGQNCSGLISNGQNLVINGDFSQGYTGWTHNPAYTVYTPCNNCYSVPGKIYAGANPGNFNHAFSNYPDHSPTSDSKFLMVDGICQLGINLWSQSDIPILPNTNYFFSVWITSLDNTSPYGTLRFDINGTPLGTPISAPGIPGTWVKFTAYWNSGPNPPASVTISIQNTTTTGCDTAVDFGIDDISFSPGCEFGTPGPLPNLGADFSICTKTPPFNINPQFDAATVSSNNVRYTWYKNGIAQDSGFGSSFYNYSVTSAGTYSVCVDSGGSCPRTDILIIRPPAVSNAGNDQRICNATSVVLKGNAISSVGATGTWSVASGSGQISNLHDSATIVTGISAGDLVLTWTITDSPCVPSSSSVTIHRDTLSVPVLSLTGTSYDTCAFTTGLTYSTTVNNLNTHYSWMTSGTLFISSPANTNSVTVDIGASGGTITVTDTNGVCVLSASKDVVVAPNVSPPVAGIDQMPCVDSTFVSATAPLVGKGYWTVSSGSGIFSNSSDPLSKVTGLSNGVNKFIWTVSGCGGPLADTVIIDVGISGITLSDPIGPIDTMCFRTPRLLSVLATGGSGFYDYVWTSSDHSFNTVTDHSSVYVAPVSNVSTYYVYAEDSKNYGCKSKGDSVVVHSLGRQDLTLNNLVTPNGDDRNDQLIVRDNETFKKILPGARLDIYNQWGTKIYESDNYNNTWTAEEVEDGIYYYYLKAGCGGESYKGWVQIIR
jgi:hypothetical protein